MNANVAMQVATTKRFGDLEIQVYENPAVGHSRVQDDFWMTREQIGTALEYKNPSISIGTIHKRNADRLDPLSGLINLITPGGKQQTYVYNMRGVMEICRFSTQPKANAFMDFCWDVITALMRGETVSLKSMESQKQAEVVARRQANFEVITTGLHDIAENQQLLYAQYEEMSKYRAEDRQAVENVLNYNRTLIVLVNRAIDKVEMALQGIQRLSPSGAKSEPVRYTKYQAPSSETSWYHDVKNMLEVIAKANKSDTGHVRGWFHNMLKTDYGWSVYEERKKYAKENNIDDIQSIPLGVVIEADPVCRRIFYNKVAEVYEECTGKHVEPMKEQPPLLPLDAIPKRHTVKVDPAPEVVEEKKSIVVAEAHAVEVEVPVPEMEIKVKKRKWAYKPSVTLPIIKPVAEKRGDKTIGCWATYQKIYDIIGITKMNRLTKAYTKAHKRPPKVKPDIFADSEKNMKIFKEAVRMLDAAS